MPGGQRIRQGTLTILVLGALAACAEPTSIEREMSPSFARGSTGGAPSVTSTIPSSALRGTTLDVRVLGSGFVSGSKAQWAIDGLPTGNVIVNSTRYVSSGEVVANVTVASDADLTLYDVIVSAVGGKPGIGTEVFLVALEEADLPAGTGSVSGAVAINDQAVIVGMTTDRVTGRLTSQVPQYPVRWNLVGGKWTMTKLSSVPTVRAVANAINESNVIVGMSNLRATVWLPNGTTVDLGPGCATGINESNYIVGTVVTSTGFKGVVWVPTQGTWIPQDVPGAGNPNTAAMYSCELAPLYAINGAGTLAGVAVGGAAKWIALGPTGPWSNPILLSPTGGGEAYAINEAGDIAGVASQGGTSSPHLWRANGEEIHYFSYGTGMGFAFGINDSPQPDVVAGAGSAKYATVIFGSASTSSRLSPWTGSTLYEGARDVNNPTATQPLRIVGTVKGIPKVWTYR